MRALANGIGNYRRTQPVSGPATGSAKLHGLQAAGHARSLEAQQSLSAEMAEIVRDYTVVKGNGFLTITRKGRPADFATVYVNYHFDQAGPWASTAATVSPDCRISARAFAELVQARTTARMNRDAAARLMAEGGAA